MIRAKEKPLDEKIPANHRIDEGLYPEYVSNSYKKKKPNLRMSRVAHLQMAKQQQHWGTIRSKTTLSHLLTIQTASIKTQELIRMKAERS